MQKLTYTGNVEVFLGSGSEGDSVCLHRFWYHFRGHLRRESSPKSSSRFQAAKKSYFPNVFIQRITWYPQISQPVADPIFNRDAMHADILDR